MVEPQPARERMETEYEIVILFACFASQSAPRGATGLVIQVVCWQWNLKKKLVDKLSLFGSGCPSKEYHETTVCTGRPRLLGLGLQAMQGATDGVSAGSIYTDRLSPLRVTADESGLSQRLSCVLSL